MTKIPLLVLLLAMGAAGCQDKPKRADVTDSPARLTLAAAPTFSADSAYALIERQLALGARVPNTPAHVRAGDLLIALLKQYGCTVTVQDFQPTTWDGKKLRARNIIGSINPSAVKRILLTTHWDSRPYADQDSTKAKQNLPVLAANDGASGVAILLELARTMQASAKKPTVGIDILFFDAEDGGDTSGKVDKDFEAKVGNQIGFSGFCLGSRYWANNPHKPGYSAYYGVLLDMVGAKGATFKREGYSAQFAPGVNTTIWQTASQLGYSQYFIDEAGGSITISRPT
jgi:glutaminyl-peptide cyclotransferase